MFLIHQKNTQTRLSNLHRSLFDYIPVVIDNPNDTKRGDSIWRFKLEAMTVKHIFVIIDVKYMTVYYLQLYFGSIAVIQCFLYSQITVAHVTQLKTVLSTILLFETCDLKH